MLQNEFVVLKARPDYLSDTVELDKVATDIQGLELGVLY